MSTIISFILFVDHCYIIYHITLYYIYFDDFDNDYYYPTFNIIIITIMMIIRPQ